MEHRNNIINQKHHCNIPIVKNIEKFCLSETMKIKKIKNKFNNQSF